MHYHFKKDYNMQHSIPLKMRKNLHVFIQRLKRLQNHTHWAVACLYLNRLTEVTPAPRLNQINVINVFPLNKPNLVLEEPLTQTGSPTLILCISQIQQYPPQPPGNSWAFARILIPEVGVCLLCCSHLRVFDPLTCLTPKNSLFEKRFLRVGPGEGLGTTGFD